MKVSRVIEILNSLRQVVDSDDYFIDEFERGFLYGRDDAIDDAIHRVEIEAEKEIKKEMEELVGVLDEIR